MTIKHYEVQTNTVVEGWVNCWWEGDGPLTFGSELAARRALREFFEDLPDQMAASYSESDYRITAINFEDLLTIDEGETMAQIASKLQQAISTPELRDLIDELADLYEPTDEMLEGAKYDNAHAARAWPECFDPGIAFKVES